MYIQPPHSPRIPPYKPSFPLYIHHIAIRGDSFVKNQVAVKASNLSKANRQGVHGRDTPLTRPGPIMNA